LETVIQPFAGSADHLLAELERIDLLIRARVAHVRQVQSADENFRGLYISEQEVDALLARPLGMPQWVHTPDGSRLPDVDAALTRLTQTIALRRAASIAAGIDLRLHRLAATFKLGSYDIDALLICLAVEIDLRYEKLYAYLQDDVTRRRPAVALVMHLLTATDTDLLLSRQHFLPPAPLIAHRILHVLEDAQQPHSPLLAHILKVDERVAEFLFGSDELGAELRDLVTVVSPDSGLDALPLDRLDRESFSNASGLLDQPPYPVLSLYGPAASGKASLAEALCHARGRDLLVLDVAALAADADKPAASRPGIVAALVEREAALRGAAVLWRRLDAAGEASQRTGVLRAIDQGQAPCVVTSAEAIEINAALPRRGSLSLPMPQATHAQRVDRWSAALAGRDVEPQLDVPSLATRFKLTLGTISQAAVSASRLAVVRRGPASAITARDLQDACRLHSNQKLASLARKISPAAQWNDIVLPPDRMAQLREICNQVKYRDRVYGDWGFGRKLSLGKGLAVLFAGPSGTGKTMAAGILAVELGLDLYKIDLSTVISKYIGETEKNLSRIFEEAETSNAILFFDEADALFGKRSEVRDSHDRYANVEVGYLLQRMEEYEGIAILATNFRKNMDDAFTRRLHFTVEFPFPDQEDRCRIWRGVWPAETPRDTSVDEQLLSARYEMTGGNIRNVALAAAFLAADDGGVVGMNHIVQATLREYQKTGKLMTDDSEG
jgi:hypothetical protein